MDELPNDLRDMLELARDGFDPPDDGAQQRVRVALAAAIGAPAAGAVLSGGKAAAMSSKAPAAIAAKTGWLALGGKLTAVAVGAVAATGIGIAMYTMRAPTQQPTPVAMPAPVQAPEPVSPEPTPKVEKVELEAPAPVEAPAEPKLAKPRKAAADTLAEETALLRSASEALARGDEAAALVDLRTHAQRYPRGSLREERDGLRAIAECTRDQNPSQDAAQRFARQYPNSLLAARVASACAKR